MKQVGRVEAPEGQRVMAKIYSAETHRTAPQHWWVAALNVIVLTSAFHQAP